MFKLKSTLSTAPLASLTPLSCDFLKSIYSSRNRSGLLIFSLCTIIVLTQQAVALSIPPLPSSSLSSSASSPVAAASLAMPSSASSSSLVMISPQVNNSEMASMLLVPETVATNVLTPGQRVINAVPVQDRGNFIMYQLAVGLKATEEAQSKPRWQKNLAELIRDYEHKLSDLKNVPIYGNFAADLLQWLMEKFNLTHQDVYNHLQSRTQLLCTTDGVCYSSDDLGCFCCPF